MGGSIDPPASGPLCPLGTAGPVLVANHLVQSHEQTFRFVEINMSAVRGVQRSKHG